MCVFIIFASHCLFIDRVIIESLLEQDGNRQVPGTFWQSNATYAAALMDQLLIAEIWIVASCVLCVSRITADVCNRLRLCNSIRALRGNAGYWAGSFRKLFARHVCFAVNTALCSHPRLLRRHTQRSAAEDRVQYEQVTWWEEGLFVCETSGFLFFFFASVCFESPSWVSISMFF